MSCVVCREPGPELCSWTCLKRATAELDANVAALRSQASDDGDQRDRLAARNGELTSALLRHPQPPERIG